MRNTTRHIRHPAARALTLACLTVLLAFITEAQGQGCTRTFEGDAPEPGEQNLWQNRRNWSGDQLPGPSDDVCIGGSFNVIFSAPGGLVSIRSLTSQGSLTITRGARLEFSANSTINGALTLGSDAPDPSLGTLHGIVDGVPQTMTLAGAFNWTGGTLSGDGVFDANGGITISGVLGKELRGPTLNNPGTATWGGMGDIGIGGRFNNTGTFTVNNSARFIPLSNAPGFFNEGIFRKNSAGTTTFFNSVEFHNTNAVFVERGILELRGGGNSTGDFFITVSSSDTAILFTAGFYILEGAKFRGDGSVIVDGAVVTVAGTVEATNFRVVSRVLDVAGTLVVSNNLEWTGGTISGGGVVNANTSLKIDGPDSKTLFGAMLNNHRSGVASRGNIGIGGGAVFKNMAGATFVVLFLDLPPFHQFNIVSAGGEGGSFDNAGTFEAGGHPVLGVLSIHVAFNNSHIVNTQRSVIDLRGGGTSTGTFSLQDSLNFISGFYTLNGAKFRGDGYPNVNGAVVTVTGTVEATNFSVSSGTLGVTGTLTVSDALVWLRGTITGTGAINSNGEMRLLEPEVFGPGDKTLTGNGLRLNNAGMARWSGRGNIEIGGDSVFSNLSGASFVVKNDQSIFATGSGGRFKNAGSFIKSESTGTTFIGIPFENTGSLSVNSGTIRFAQGLFNNAGGTINGRSTLEGRIFNRGSVSPGESPGTLNILGDYTQEATGAFEAEIAGAGAGQFDQLTVSGTATLAGTLNITLLDGFLPAVGDTFTILTCSARSGTFATINGLNLPGGRSFEVDYRPNGVALITRGTSTSTLQFSAAAYTVGEGDLRVVVTVTRAGDTSGEASVNYATSDGTASERRDYTAALGNLRFAPGETMKSFDVLITNDAFDDDGESFQLTLSNAVGAALGSQSTAIVQIADDDAVNGPSPVRDASLNVEFFVRQHYADFLGRVPDAPGLNFWIGQAAACGNPDPLVCRINVSAAFFLSIEFQETGYLVHRAYKAAYGNLQGKPVPVTLREFLAGSRQIGEGVEVGVGNWQQQLEANKEAFFNQFVLRSQFTALYNSLTNAQYVDALNQNAGGALLPAERDALVNALNGGTMTRAAALRAAAEDADFAAAERNRAFVLAQYFGYLRRNPDEIGFGGQADPNFEGFHFWLSKLNQFGGNFIEAEMVRAFIQSIEYGDRFGQ